jgi:dolichol-phosphate mannosyltransferase
MSYDLSIVIPAYNEEKSVEPLLRALGSFIEGFGKSFQLVFVDDGSTDNTVDYLEQFFSIRYPTKIIKLSRNFGSHAAIRAGISNADSDFIVIYSMDIPEPVEDIAMMYEELRAGYEIVYTERIGYRGSLGSRIFARLVNACIDSDYPANGLVGVAFGPKAKREINYVQEPDSSVFFQLFQMGFRKKSIAVKYQERQQGESKWTLRKKLKLFVDSFIMFSFMPLRLITGLGTLMAITGLIWALAVLAIKVTNLIELSAGWPTILSILLLGFGATNLSLGVIAEYLVRTLNVSRRRRVYIIDEIIESVSQKN